MKPKKDFYNRPLPMLRKKIVLAGLTVILILAAVTFVLHGIIVDIRSPWPDPIPAAETISVTGRDTVRFGVISRFPSNVLYQGYQPLMDYLSAQTDYHFELIISRSYEETVAQLASGKVHAAFLGSYIYITSREEQGLIPILKPLNENGEPFFTSVIIVQGGSDIHSVSELRGRSLALPSENSFSGNWLLSSGLARHGMEPGDLSHIEHFRHHHSVVYEVLRSNFDAGSIKDRVADEFLDQGLRIIAHSDPVPGSPVVVSARHDPDITGAITDVLLSINPSDPMYALLVSQWDPEFRNGFMRAEAADYDQLAQEILGGHWP
jgi:phosphonate transport system substrate-binding protein